MHAFARQAMAAHPHLLVASGKCSAYTGSGDPYLPFLKIMQMLTGDVESRWEAGDISADHARRLWSVLPEMTKALLANGRLLLDRFISSAPLLIRAQIRTRSQPPGSAPWLAQLTEWVQGGEMMAALSQTDLFEQYTALLETLARRHPLLLLLDDLQWIDSGSLNLFFHLGQHLSSGHILILGAYRPGDVARGKDGQPHPLVGVVHEMQQIFGHEQIDLSQVEGRPFIDALLDSEPNRMDETFREMMYRQTGGQALFTIELLRGLQERSDLVQDEDGRWVKSNHLDWEILPARVEAVIAGRIGRLPPACHTALTIASVEGETFTAEVVAAIQKVDEQETVRCLSGDLSRQHHLVATQSRQRLGQQNLSRYRFHHILFQKYLYNHLDPVERADLHEAVGTVLEKFYGTHEVALATMFGRLAWHFQEAGMFEKAIAYHKKAGDYAWQLSAANEAIAHLQQGLALLETLPGSTERKQQELNLRMSLAMPLQAAKGFAAPEFGDNCDRAYLLSQQVGQTPQLIIILSALGSYYLTTSQYRIGLRLTLQKLALAQRFEDDLQIALARLGLAANYTQLGQFAHGRKQIDELLNFYDFRKHHTLAADHSIDPGVNGLIWAAIVTWIMGYPDQAQRHSEKAIDWARILEHPFSLVAALEVSGTILHIWRREYQAAADKLEVSLQLAAEQKFSSFLPEGMFYQGYLQVQNGQMAAGIAQMKQALAGWRATGMRIMYSQMLGLLALALAQAGQVGEGLRKLEEAFAEIKDRDERFFVAELYRIKGDLLQQCDTEKPVLSKNEATVIETAYQQAITIARQQNAKLWELRATLRLARLWQSQGKNSQARVVLAELFDWFTEGFDTPDLQDARTLLNELTNEQREH